MSRVPGLSPARLLPLLLAAALPTVHAQTPPAAYPGTLALDIDATDLAHRIFHAHERIPVQPGPLTLLYPRWLPGHHSPSGPIDKIAGLVFMANGQRLAWTRDPLDVYAFRLDIPTGVDTLEVAFDFLSPTDRNPGRVVMTPAMLNLQSNTVAL
jgi:hypothetical protein